MNENISATSLSGWRLLLARIFWIFAFLLCSAFLLASLPVISRLTEREWLVVSSYPTVLEIMKYTSYVRYVVIIRYISLAIFLAAALIIYWRKSRDWVALLTSSTLVLVPTAFFFSIEYPAFSPLWQPLLENMQGLITGLAMICLILFINLFPDGKFALRGMSIWIMLSMGFIITLMISMNFLAEFIWWILIASFVIVTIISVYAQTYRYRHLKSHAHRQQIKWVLFAFGFTAGGFLWMTLLGFVQVGGKEALINFITLHLGQLMLTTIPIAMSISIFRYRLWDIDVIIRRTLIYGSLTATLLAIYLISVVSSQSLIAALGGLHSEVGIVISTLVISALFNPLRRRIQNDIDHRFYREKYDAGQALARFVAVARDETNLDRLESALVQVVQETIQPESISLWMRDSGE